MSKQQDISDDGRKLGDYATRYTDATCQRKIKRDAIYIAALLGISILCIFLNFMEVFENILGLEGERQILFHKTMYCATSSLLGGATFGMKYFYRVVARGLWNEDRVYWRVFSPWIAVALSIVMSAIMIKDVSTSSSLAITIGFLTGYFSDEAVSKMYDVACVLFLKSDNKEIEYKDKIEQQIEREKNEDRNALDCQEN